MYNAQIIKERIKSLCKNKKISMENMLLECSLGVNAIRQINDTKGMASFSLAKIADYLECSVDYLLGRSDDTHMFISNAKDNAVAISQSGSATATIKNGKERELTKQEQALLQIYNNADDKTQVKIMQFMYDLEKKERND